LPVAGAGIVNAKKALRFNQTENDEDLADYLSAVGTFGLFSDIVSKYGRHPVKGTEFIAGPTFSDAGELWKSGSALTQEGNPKPLARLAVGHIPIAGPTLRGLFNEPKKKKNPNSLEKLRLK